MRNPANSTLSAASRQPRGGSLRWIAVAVVALALVAACSSDKKAGSASSSSGPPTTTKADKALQDGLAAQNAGDLETARKKYLEVLDQDPTNKYAHYDLGVIYQQLGDAGRARDEYLKALVIDTKFKPAIFNLGVLETPTDPSRAEDYYRQYLQIDPNEASVHFNLGLLLRAQGKASEGDVEVQKALQIDPSLASRLPASSSSSASG